MLKIESTSSAFGVTSEDFGDTLDNFGSTLEKIGATSDDFGSTSEKIGSTSDDFGFTSEKIGATSSDFGSTSEKIGATSSNFESTLYNDGASSPIRELSALIQRPTGEFLKIYYNQSNIPGRMAEIILALKEKKDFRSQKCGRLPVYPEIEKSEPMIE